MKFDSTPYRDLHTTCHRILRRYWNTRTRYAPNSPQAFAARVNAWNVHNLGGPEMRRTLNWAAKIARANPPKNARVVLGERATKYAADLQKMGVGCDQIELREEA